MKTYYALKSVGHFLPGMAINVELSEERVQTLTKSGYITTEKPKEIVVNEEKSKLAAKNAKVTKGEDGDSDEDDDKDSLLESAKEKLAKNKRLTMDEIKAVLDEEFVEYGDDLSHSELMKLIPSKEA